MYSLGVDLGTTFVAAAIAHESQVEMVTLGDRSVVAPAVVYLREDGTIVTGDAAVRRAVSNPDRVGREFKRRLGDPTPVMLGNTPHAVGALLGALLHDVLHKVIETEGGPPERVVLTHPANWGPFRRELFEDVPEAAGLTGLTTWRTVSEPEAAAAHYAATRRLNDGETVAVYDLGGGTFDATILSKGPEGIEILGTPEGIERLGGVDFDEAVMSYVNVSSGGALSELDMGDPATAIALARLRQDCVLAKEALSVDTETTIPVFLPHRHFEVRLTRPEFEGMLRAPIESTVAALSRTLRSAQVTPEQLSAVLLVGGSSRIPLVGRMLTEQLGRPTVVDTHPKHAVALGAATLAEVASHPMQTWYLPGQHTHPAERARRSHDARPEGAPSTPVPAAAAAQVPSPAAFPAPPAPRDNGITPGVAAPAAPGANGGTNHTAGATAGDRGGGAPPFGAGSPPHPPGPPKPPPAGPAPPPLAQPRRRDRRTALAIGAALLVLGLVVGFVLWPRGQTAGPDTTSGTGPPVLTRPAAAPPASVANPVVGAVFPVGAGPQAGAITPDGRFAYVTSTSTSTISVVDLATNAVAASIPVAAGPPVFVAFTPDGARAYVSVFDEIRGTGNAVVVLDTASKAVTATIPADRYPYAIAVSPDGRQLFVPNHDANLVSVVDTRTNTVQKKITVKPNPHSVAFSVDGRRAYVANHQSNLVTVLDTKNGIVLTEIPVGQSPHSLAMSPDGQRVYVVDYDADTVSVIDPAANTVSGTIAVQREPQSVAFAPDGRHAYVVNDGSNTVSVIDTATNQVTTTVGVGQAPTDVFVAPDGRHAYVTNISSNNVTVLNIAG
ncbi:Hsp70 family protein [Pseudonocardia acidicola]|uniref:Hsp70 family protein n=1 Tax=Pseudonocardia acidicola TaxID=2724939 RepID=A0ABX1SGJ0_9PSEU|nr:Hsp70 family protein [Pseudonocardia acidicola]NMH99992.1 Hsp70 family protein [Pseudonocardia acidicola]